MRVTIRFIVWAVLFNVAFTIVGCSNPDADSNLDLPTTAASTPDTPQTERFPGATSDAITSTANPEEALWSTLQQADTHYFVLMRHASAPGTGDPTNFQLGDCTTQRNLSEEGRAQARLIGEAFTDRDMPVRRVLSSQWCRCLETANLMNIGSVEPFPPLNSFFRDRSKNSEQTEQVREFMHEYKDTPGVTVMVTHFVNISALTETDLLSGEMIVIYVNNQNQLEVVGQLRP